MVDRSVDWMVRRALEGSCDGIWLLDTAGRISYANPRAGELLGRSVDDLVGRSMLDLLDEQGRDQFRDHLRELRERGANDADVECRLRRPDGELVRLMVGESAVRDEDGTVIGYLHRMIGESQQLRMLDEITRGRAQLADAESIARLGSWEIDYATDTLTWSPMIYEVLDLDPETTEPDLAIFFELLHTDDRPGVEQEYAAARAVPGERSVDARLVLADQEIRWVRIIGRLLEQDADGEPIRVGGTVQDITEAKETELRLRDAVVLNTLMQFMASAMNEASTVHDAAVTLRTLLLDHWDWQAAVAFEVRADGVLVPMRVGEEQHNERERLIALRALDTGGVVFDEDLAPETPSLAFPVTVRGRVLLVAVITATSPFERHPMLRTMAEQVAGQLATVAAREEAARELAAARDDAMEASLAKSEFVATMSHEIRTPLNGVIGLNELLLDSDLDEHQRRLAEGIQGAGRALLRLINDILDFSKIEAGALEFERTPFSPAQVVTDVLDLFRPEAERRGNRLDATFAGAVPSVLVGDSGRFRQVLSNLVSNAVKFTSDGVVTVTVRASWVGRDVEMRLEVADTGIGMTAEELEHVFDPFRQSDASTTRHYGGTGLGLTIARQLAAAFDGELGATSAPGVGSTFWFTSCFGTATTDVAHADEQTRRFVRSQARVLVVEDNETNQLVARGMLEALGCTVDVAVDGREGAERALAGEYDVVLMDLQMPGADGFEGTRLIREGLAPGRRLPVIALTASATSGVRERCVAAGMDGFLTKPLNRDRLEEEVQRCLGLREAAPAADAAGRVLGRPAASQGQQWSGAVGVLDPGRLEELAEMGEAAAPLIGRAVDNFVRRAPEDLAELRHAVAESDGEALRMSAHRLKGSAANLGLRRVAELALALEELGRTDAPTAAPDVLDDLAAALAQGVDAVERHPVVGWCRALATNQGRPGS